MVKKISKANKKAIRERIRAAESVALSRTMQQLMLRGEKRKKRSKRSKLNFVRQVGAPISVGTVTHSRPCPPVRIHKRERFGTLAQTGYFDAYYIQPGRDIMFPWLSGVAKLFETYYFDSLKFVYVPLCATTTLGKLIMAVDYDAADPIAVTSQQLESYDGATTCNVWAMNELVIPPSKLHSRKEWFTRLVPSGVVESRQCDVGSLQIHTEGTTGGGAVIGTLYVEYDVVLLTPQVADTSLATSLASSGVDATAAKPFGPTSSVTTDANSTAFWAYDGSGTNSRFRLDGTAGDWLLTITATAASDLANIIFNAHSNIDASLFQQTYTGISGIYEVLVRVADATAASFFDLSFAAATTLSAITANFVRIPRGLLNAD